jgi:hypothetical protein
MIELGANNCISMLNTMRTNKWNRLKTEQCDLFPSGVIATGPEVNIPECVLTGGCSFFFLKEIVG